MSIAQTCGWLEDVFVVAIFFLGDHSLDMPKRVSPRCGSFGRIVSLTRLPRLVIPLGLLIYISRVIGKSLSFIGMLLLKSMMKKIDANGAC